MTACIHLCVLASMRECAFSCERECVHVFVCACVNVFINYYLSSCEFLCARKLLRALMRA